MPEISLSRKSIQNIIDEIEGNRLVLPDFQRDFVWRTDLIGKLLESMCNGYYINTLLTIPVVGNGGNVPFAPRSIRDRTNLEFHDAAVNIEMILDGQQRITSLYYALIAPNYKLKNTDHPQLFGLKFSRVVQGIFDEDTIIWKSKYHPVWGQLTNDDYQIQIDRNFIPFTIFKNPNIYEDWKDGIEDYSHNNNDILSQDQIRQFHRNTRPFRNYNLPIIQLSAETPPETVVQTFERINTQGLELGVFDILTARLWQYDIHLRDLWEDTINNYNHIQNYIDDTTEKWVRERILKTLALLTGGECKDASLRNLEPTNFSEHWTQASQILDRAIDKAKRAVEGGFGVTDKYGFPYDAMLPTFANILYIAEQTQNIPRQNALDKVKRWYWTSIFGKRYAGSSDTKLKKDYDEIKSWIIDNNAPVPESITLQQSIPNILNLYKLTKGGPYTGIMSRIVLNGAQNFQTNESVGIHQVDDHHIFPASRLRDGLNGRQYDKIARNRILNRTIIHYRENRIDIRNEFPSQYIQEMIDNHPDGEQGIRNKLQGHFIGTEGFDALLNDDYESFCMDRKNQIQNEINNALQQNLNWDQQIIE